MKTPSGMVLDGSQDVIEAPPPCDALTNANEIDPAVVDRARVDPRIPARRPK